MAEGPGPLAQNAPNIGGAPTGPNPYAASYWANLAALEFSTNTAIAAAQRETAEANANYAYNRGANTRAEPLKLRANQNAANTAGLAESGALAKTQANTQVDYAQKNDRLAEQRRSAVQRFQETEKNALQGFYKGVGVENARAQEAGLKYAEEHPTPLPAAATTAPAPNKPYNPKTTSGVLKEGAAKPPTIVKTGEASPVHPAQAAREMNERNRKRAIQAAKGVG